MRGCIIYIIRLYFFGLLVYREMYVYIFTFKLDEVEEIISRGEGGRN